MTAWRARVEIRTWPEGGYIAEVPALQGCWVVAPTVEEAIRDIHEGVQMSIESRLKLGEPLPAEIEEVRTPRDAAAVSVDLAITVG